MFDCWFDSALSWNFVLNEGQGNKALEEMEAKILNDLALGREQKATGEMLEEGKGRGRGRRVAKRVPSKTAPARQVKSRSEADQIFQI